MAMVNRPKPDSLLVLLAVFCALPTLAQPQPDTLAFAQHMAPYRTPGRELTAREVKSIQTEYLAWLNARVIAGRTIDLMNAELAAAELTDRENRKGGQTGYVAKIQPSPESAPPDALNLPADLMTVVLRIYTGKDCGADDTLVLYRRATRQRIGWLNAETDYTHGHFFGAVAAAAEDPSGARLVATDWIASGCLFSHRQVFRIDSIARENATQILAQSPAEAQEYSTRILLDKDTVQFKFESGYPSIGKADRQSEQRYLVQGFRALRLAPLGLSPYEFIWEWLRLDDADAARFSTPDAAAQHHGVMTVGDVGAGALSETDCPGAPIREFRGDWITTERFAYFRVSGTTPDTYRMESIGDKTICDSVVLPPPQADTVLFARYMTRYRKIEHDLTAAEVKSIQAEYLAWLNARVTAGMSIEQMNIELNSGKLLTATNSANVNDFGKSYTGFVGTIHSNAANADVEDDKAPDDLLLFILPIYTGPGCNEDETLVLYNRETRQRIGWINGETTYRHGLLFGAMAAQPQGSDSTRLVATDWITSNCTSNWNGQIFRIDALANGRGTQVLDHSPADGAMAGSTKIQIEKDTVQFTYYSYANVTDPDGSLPLPVERYRVRGTRALRLGPLAETLDGFIEEWLGIEDGEAVRFGSPATATQHRALRTRRSEEWYSFTDAAECPGTPPTHQVRALWDKSKRTTYFRVSGDTAATLRMESVTDSPIPGCRSSRLDDIHQRMR
jgi:uncharacterized protein involved in tolerance to divalent cations